MDARVKDAGSGNFTYVFSNTVPADAKGSFPIAAALLLRLDRSAPVVDKPSGPEYPAGLDAEALTAITIAVTMHQAVRRREAAPAMRRYRPGTRPSRWVNVGRHLQNTSWHPGRRVQ